MKRLLRLHGPYPSNLFEFPDKFPVSLAVYRLAQEHTYGAVYVEANGFVGNRLAAKMRQDVYQHNRNRLRKK